MSFNAYSRGPRYSAVAAALAADIDNGRYTVGSTLPTEAELRQRFGVSRHTVREALRELKARGLVSSHSGIGTRVRAKPADERFVHGVSSLQQLLQVVESTRMTVVKTRDLVADAAWADLLRCLPGQHWVEVLVLRWLPGKDLPIAQISSFIPPEYADIIERINDSTRPIFSLIEEQHGARVVEIRQEVTAVTLDETQAERLNAAVGDTALKIIRHHLDAQDRVAQASIGIYPTDRSSYVTSFRVQRGAGE